MTSGEQLPEGGIVLSPAEIDALDARWSSCWTPGQVASSFAISSTSAAAWDMGGS